MDRVRTARRPWWSRLAILLTVTGLGAAASWWLGAVAQRVLADRQAPWIVGRATGLAAYALLLAVVVMGLLLAHPWRTRWTRPGRVARIRLHASLATFTLVFTVLHVVVLATDSYAGVGWRGALLPLGASYRPVAVTLGVIGLYAGLLAGVTASLAGRLTARVWWPLHKVSASALVLVWLHGLFAGSDSAGLRLGYAASGLAVAALAASRYLARSPRDRVEALLRADGDTWTDADIRADGGVRPLDLIGRAR
jgi:hypothetical protein